MTDTTAAQFDAALVAETTYERKGFFLPEFAVHHFRAGQAVIEGKTFIDCIFEGPAILMAVDGVEFDGCAMGSTNDGKNLLLQAVGERVTGVVPFSRTKFIRCKFNRIGYTGHPDFLASFGSLAKMSESGAA